MNIGIFKYYKPGVLISLIALLSISIFFAKSHLGVTIPIIGSITSLIVLIDRYLWKKRLFSWMFWIEDFSGTYKGQLNYEFRDDQCVLQKGGLDHVKTIHQTGSKIRIYSFFIKDDGSKSSTSEDTGLYVEKIEGSQYKLIYSYRNDGSTDLSPHYGTEIVKFIKDGNKKILSGRYFTERLPYQTKGTFENLIWESNKENHSF